jgi:hypothetical protein
MLACQLGRNEPAFLRFREAGAQALRQLPQGGPQAAFRCGWRHGEGRCEEGRWRAALRMRGGEGEGGGARDGGMGGTLSTNPR